MTENHGPNGPQNPGQQPQGPYGQQPPQYPSQPGQQPGQQYPPQQSAYGQPQQPGQPWQGQPPQPGGPGKGVNKGLVVGIVALVLIVVGGIIAAVILLGGDDKDDDDDDSGGTNNSSTALTPVETVEAFVEAGLSGDCDKVQSLMVDGDGFDCSQLNVEDYELKSAEEKSVEGDKAVVETEYVQNGNTDTEDFPLTRVDGVWLVDLTGGDSGSDSGSDGGSDDGGDTAQTSPATGPSPLSLMADFTEAIKANDCDAAKALLLDPDSADCSEITTDDAEQVEFGSPQLVSDGAQESTVSSEMTAGGTTVGTFTVDFVLDDDGLWKIDSWNY